MPRTFSVQVLNSVKPLFKCIFFSGCPLLSSPSLGVGWECRVGVIYLISVIHRFEVIVCVIGHLTEGVMCNVGLRYILYQTIGDNCELGQFHCLYKCKLNFP